MLARDCFFFPFLFFDDQSNIGGEEGVLNCSLSISLFLCVCVCVCVCVCRQCQRIGIICAVAAVLWAVHYFIAPKSDCDYIPLENGQNVQDDKPQNDEVSLSGDPAGVDLCTAV